MKLQNLKRLAGLITVLGAVLLFTAEASATPVGLLRLDSDAFGVTVGLNFLDWLPAGPPNGTFKVGAGTTLTSAAGNPIAGTVGTLLDLGPATVLPLPNFMTFTGFPGLALDLAFIGPGSANTACVGLLNGGSCSIFAGSPFILTLNGNNTNVGFAVGGIARDGTTPSNWQGSFTTQIAGMTPAQIQALFGSNPNATINSTYSGEFLVSVTPVPEPVTLELLGVGLAGLAFVRRRKK